MQLILQPCSDPHARQHFNDTIQTPVLTSRLLPFLQATERDVVNSTFPDGVAVWGVTPGKKQVNAAKWRRIGIGDTALLYRDRKFFFRGTVAYKTHARDLALELWGTNSNQETWEYVFFLTELEPLEIPIETFNRVAGYQSNFVVQGFNVLSAAKSEELLEALELGDPLGTSLPTHHDETSARHALNDMDGELDATGRSRRRREQAYLRTILLGKKHTDTCAVCGRTVPVNLLVIGHIRKRHSCSHEMKRDLANVMSICILGCDSLFEHGYIYIDEQGRIRAHTAATSIPSLKSVADSIVGRACSAWNANSEPYFAWHRAHPRKFL